MVIFIWVLIWSIFAFTYKVSGHKIWRLKIEDIFSCPIFGFLSAHFRNRTIHFSMDQFYILFSFEIGLWITWISIQMASWNWSIANLLDESLEFWISISSSSSQLESLFSLQQNIFNILFLSFWLFNTVKTPSSSWQYLNIWMCWILPLSI